MNKKIKFLRKELLLSQYELAEAAGIARYKIQLLEQGIPCLTEKEAERLLKLLGIQLTNPSDLYQIVNEELDYE